MDLETEPQANLAPGCWTRDLGAMGWAHATAPSAAEQVREICNTLMASERLQRIAPKDFIKPFLLLAKQLSLPAYIHCVLQFRASA